MNNDRINEFSDRFDRAGKVFLLTLGPAGSTFLQSFFDSDPKILMVPTVFKANKLFNETKNMSTGDMASFISDKSTLKYVFHNKKTLKLGDFSKYQISRNVFSEEFGKYWKRGVRNEKRFLESVHYAFMMATGKILYDFNTIFVHFHTGQDVPQLLNDYPDAKWLSIVRNPIAMFYSNFVRYKTYRGRSFGYDYCWMKALLSIRGTMNYTTNISELEKDRHFIIKNEELNNNPEGVIKDIAKKIGIDFDDNLLSSTIGGVPYVSTSPLNKGIRGASKKIMEPKHKKELSEKDILYLETFYKKDLEIYRYNFESRADFNKEHMYRYKIGNKSLLYKIKFIIRCLGQPNNDEMLLLDDDRTVLQAIIERHIILKKISKMSGDGFIKVLLTVYFLINSIKINKKLRKDVNANIKIITMDKKPKDIIQSPSKYLVSA
jgi:hypothetical protein